MKPARRERARAAKPAKPKPSVDDAAIGDAIEAQLRRKTTPALTAIDLWSGVRHRLGSPRILLRRVRAVADALVASRRLDASDEQFVRYRLARTVRARRRSFSGRS